MPQRIPKDTGVTGFIIILGLCRILVWPSKTPIPTTVRQVKAPLQATVPVVKPVNGKRRYVLWSTARLPWILMRQPGPPPSR